MTNGGHIWELAGSGQHDHGPRFVTWLIGWRIYTALGNVPGYSSFSPLVDACCGQVFTDRPRSRVGRKTGPVRWLSVVRVVVRRGQPGTSGISERAKMLCGCAAKPGEPVLADPRPVFTPAAAWFGNAVRSSRGFGVGQHVPFTPARDRRIRTGAGADPARAGPGLHRSG